MSINKKTEIDPRGPRFGATITSVLLLVVIWLSLDSASLPAALILFEVLAFLFALGAVLGTSRTPYAFIFRRLIRPRLKPPSYLEDSKPPQFAQGVGLFVTLTGLTLYFGGVTSGILFAAVAAFIAAFLNAAFNLCLGCQLYLVLRRLSSRN
jgi:hypothetical protein